MTRPLLTIVEVAERLSCSQVHARRIAREIGIVKVGRLVRVRPEDLDRFIAEGGSTYDPVKVVARREARETGTPPPARDAEYFAKLREKYGHKRSQAHRSSRRLTSILPRGSRLRVPVAKRKS